MSDVNYAKVAEVLDTVAEYIDGIEHTKTAKEQSARDERVEKFATQYSASTGESLPDNLRNKMAGLDQEALDHILKVANNTGDSPESMGGPAETQDSPNPRTVKEAAAVADDKFLDWIINE